MPFSAYQALKTALPLPPTPAIVGYVERKTKD